LYVSWGDGEFYKAFKGDYNPKDWVQLESVGISRLPDNMYCDDANEVVKVGFINAYWGIKDLFTGLFGWIKK
jgi:hypothetical protein